MASAGLGGQVLTVVHISADTIGMGVDHQRRKVQVQGTLTVDLSRPGLHVLGAVHPADHNRPPYGGHLAPKYLTL